MNAVANVFRRVRSKGTEGGDPGSNPHRPWRWRVGRKLERCHDRSGSNERAAGVHRPECTNYGTHLAFSNPGGDHVERAASTVDDLEESLEFYDGRKSDHCFVRLKSRAIQPTDSCALSHADHSRRSARVLQ